MKPFWRERHPPLLLLAASAAALGVALIAQFGFGLEPCHLCTIQRMPYLFAILVAAMASTEVHHDRGRAFLLGFLAAIFAANIGIAFFHVGVESHWWESACSGGETLSTSAGGLLAKLALGKPPPACDSVPFALFGVSIAGMNLIGSAALAGYAGWAARRAWRHS